MPRQKQFKISLIGDSCIDEYQYGRVDRLSAEAPVPIFKYSHSVTLPGMAGNVRENLHVLGCEVSFHTGPLSTKTRILDERSNHHICRIDRDVINNCPVQVEEVDLDADAIVISDYNKGAVSPNLARSLREKFSGPIFVDTKTSDLSRFDGCYLKINEPEFNARTSAHERVIVTRGSNSVLYYTIGDAEEFEVKPVQAFDVCGAGDTFLAALAYRYLHDHDIKASIRFAIKAASVTVQHIGVYAPTLQEIKDAP